MEFCLVKEAWLGLMKDFLTSLAGQWENGLPCKVVSFPSWGEVQTETGKQLGRIPELGCG